uniref:Mitochondrial inner membrane protein Mpv17 n=1 Tax=Setaria digitata TaxID=48799 RepID=A0A915PRG0_9BILA
MLAATYRAYERALAKYPFMTQTSSAGALAAMADILTQNFVEKRLSNMEYNPARTIRFSSVILFWIAPITYRWFLLLEKLKGKAPLLPFKRMILDQCLAAPIFTFSFITNLRILEGNSPYDALEKASNDIIPVMKTNYKV